MARTPRHSARTSPLYVRYGVNSAEAVELISSGLRSSAFAHRVAAVAQAQRFDDGACASGFRACRSIDGERLFEGTPADFLDLLQFDSHKRARPNRALLSDEQAEVQAELEEQTANGTVTMHPIETDRPPQRFGVYRDTELLGVVLRERHTRM